MKEPVLTDGERLRMHAARRARLLRELDGGTAVFKTHGMRSRNIHHEYPFRPESDFYYLTGFDEPDAIALFAPHAKERFVLFVRTYTREEEIWLGPHTTPRTARRRFGADAVYPLDRFEEVLQKSFSPTGRLYYRVGDDAPFDDRMLALIKRCRPLARRGVNAPTELIDAHSIVQWMRQRKSPAELRLMARAAAISAEGHRAALEAVRPGMWEYEVEALLTYHFRRHRATGHAYHPIVASGENATYLHYNASSRRMRDGDLLLLDAGAEYDYYASDVTRTIPVNGRFSREQRAIYDLVLAAHDAVIARVRPGVPFPKLQERAIAVITRGLVRLGLLKGRTSALIARKAYTRFYMHGVGHWLGLDTHDASPYKTTAGKDVRLATGMVFTVEPGIYIRSDDRSVPARWRGIGVRIEDNVVVTTRGARLLTAAIPREADEIERIMARARRDNDAV